MTNVLLPANSEGFDERDSTHSVREMSRDRRIARKAFLAERLFELVLKGEGQVDRTDALRTVADDWLTTVDEVHYGVQAGVAQGKFKLSNDGTKYVIVNPHS